VGRRIPTKGQFEAWERRALLLGDWLHRGYGVRGLAAKYGLTESAVKRLLTIARKRCGEERERILETRRRTARLMDRGTLFRPPIECRRGGT